MAQSKAGERLTEDEVREFVSYGNQRLALPEKFNGVVFDNSAPGEAFYRWPTDEEVKQASDAARAREEAAAVDARVREQAQKEAAKSQNAAPAPPPRPEE